MKDRLPIDYAFSSIMKGHKKIAVITGSGIDSESGLPTFRGEKGYYEDRETTYLASVEALNYDPIKQWHWYLSRFLSYIDTLPGISHNCLAKVEKTIGEKFLGLVTQNISGLHRKAGSQKVYEIHGSINEMRNLFTDKCVPIPRSWLKSIPKSEELANWRPNVCFIGENYEHYPLNDSVKACESCEILLVIGTAGVIHTPVWIANCARDSGAVVININPNHGELDKVSHYVFRGMASDYFKEKN